MTRQRREIQDLRRQVIALEEKLLAEQKRWSANQVTRHSLEERLSKAFHASPVMMTIVSCHDFRFIDVNERFLKTTGFSRDEIVGRINRWTDEWGEQHPDLRLTLREQVPVADLEVTFYTRSGKERQGLYSREIIFLSGEPCFLEALIDITERKIVESALFRLDRLNLAGRIAAGIAHEIRNPMTAVRGFAQILQSRHDCAPYKRYLDIMINELDQANAVITEFLSLAGNNSLELKPLNLNNILWELLPLIRSDAVKYGHCVAYELEAMPDLSLDEKQIGQLALNLARNGLEAMPDPGTLTIRTFLDQGRVVLSVSDQGAGIEPRVLEKLGTPFLTTKERRPGLGLAVCYRVAERHGADLRVETGSGGTTFRVVFGVNQERRKAGRAAPLSAPGLLQRPGAGGEAPGVPGV